MTTIKTDNLVGTKVKVKKVDPFITFMLAVGLEVPEEITEEFYEGEYEITAKVDENFKFTKRHSGDDAQELLENDNSLVPQMVSEADVDIYVIEVEKGSELGDILIDEAFDENGIFEYLVDTDDFVIVQ